MENIVCYNIRLYRLQRHLTQQELATKLGVSRSCITLWESGARFPKYSMLLKIASVLQLPIEALTGNLTDISQSEYELLERYRNASSENQDSVRSILGIEP